MKKITKQLNKAKQERLEKHLAYMRAYSRERSKTPKRRAYMREWVRQYRLKYPEREWRKNNRERDRELRREQQKRYLAVPEKRMVMILRVRIKNALLKGKAQKHGTTKGLLGVSIPEVRKYLESQFQPGMSWKNHGKYEVKKNNGRRVWNIDHIKPLASFDLTKESEQKRALHYTNLQPLWAEENLRKGARVS